MNEPNKTNDPKGGAKGGPGKKFPGSPRFNFNFYWIYGIIIVILIVTQLFQWGTAEVKISIDGFEKMLAQKDIARIEVTNQTAHVFIKKEKLSEPKYEKVRYKRWVNVENP